MVDTVGNIVAEGGRDKVHNNKRQILRLEQSLT